MTVHELQESEEGVLCDSEVAAYLDVLVKTGAMSSPPPGVVKHPDATPLTWSIITLFERHLKYTPANDQWGATGRSRFSRGVEQFVAAHRPVEFVLPAFPCKSSNRNKVIGAFPDKGEELALRTLKLFADAVSEIYPPGVLMRIVSDGHVFSDLVGTDDHIVDEYNRALQDMSLGISSDNDLFRFAGLDDLLQLKALDRPEHSWPAPRSGTVATTRTAQAERGRAVLMRLFGKMGSIDERLSEDPALMALCRGFSKFVYEDTLQHPSLSLVSRSKQKRMAWEMAKLMVLRNEAYSRLVEVSYPHAVRLSIHPHDNSGPKFAISLLHPSFRGDVAVGRPSSSELFHIPTPWHNVVLQLPNGGYVLLKRYMLVNLDQSEHQVELVQSQNRGEGAYFRCTVRGS